MAGQLLATTVFRYIVKTREHLHQPTIIPLSRLIPIPEPKHHQVLIATDQRQQLGQDPEGKEEFAAEQDYTEGQ